MNCTTKVRRVGDVAIVDLSGRFTIADGTGRIRETVVGALESGARHILLNLAEVTLMDSAAGIGELVSSYTRTLREGGRLKLLQVNKHISRILEITQLNTVFEIYDNEDAALRSFHAFSTDPGCEPPAPSKNLKSA
jgi:anti-sigma B factor antagonist